MLPLAEIGGGTSPVRKVQAGSSLSALAGVISAAGVKRLAPVDRERPLRTLLRGWTTRTAMLGLLSGAGFGLAAVKEDSGDVALEAEQFQLALRRPLLATHLERRATVRELRLNSDAACLSHRSLTGDP